jgi:ribonuclease P protein component
LTPDLSQDFPRHARLLLPAEYDRVFAAGKRFSGSAVTLVAARALLPKAHARLGLALAKKQINRAHERNRVKRLLRECFRIKSEVLRGADVIAMSRTSAQTMTNSALKTEIDRLMHKIVDYFAPTTAAFDSRAEAGKTDTASV